MGFSCSQCLATVLTTQAAVFAWEFEELLTASETFLPPTSTLYACSTNYTITTRLWLIRGKLCHQIHSKAVSSLIPRFYLSFPGPIEPGNETKQWAPQLVIVSACSTLAGILPVTSSSALPSLIPRLLPFSPFICAHSNTEVEQLHAVLWIQT